MKVTQVKLEYLFDNMICWLPTDEYSLKVGTRLSLKNQPRVWTVVEIYSTQDHFEINRRWNVGGL
jgi:hypothetical protein